MEYTKSLVEVCEVMKYLDEKEIEKIPIDVINMINDNKDNSYQWTYDETKELKDQKLSRTTIAIISYINMEYLLNERQKEYMNNLHRENQVKLENKKMQDYNYNNIFKNKIKEPKIEKQALIKVDEEKWYEKLLKKLRNFFKKG